MKKEHTISDNRLHFIYATISFLFILGCGKSEKLDREAVKEVMAQQEVKRVTKVELMEYGSKMGSEIALFADSALLQNFLSKNSQNWELETCKIYLPEVGVNGLGVNRVSNQPMNSKNKPDSIENLILEAYQYGFDENLQIGESIQELDKEYMLYNQPIFLNDQSCLSCHGIPGQDMSEEKADIIYARYPESQSLNHKIGDLMGMWSILISKKTIVDNI